MVLVLFAAMRYIDCSLTSSHYAIRVEDKLAYIESQNQVLRQPGSSKSQNSRFQEGYSISIKVLIGFYIHAALLIPNDTYSPSFFPFYSMLKYLKISYCQYKSL